MSQPKGINFIQQGDKHLMLIHQETFLAYIQNLPADHKGWRAFSFIKLPHLNLRNAFAQIEPIPTKYP